MRPLQKHKIRVRKDEGQVEYLSTKDGTTLFNPLSLYV